MPVKDIAMTDFLLLHGMCVTRAEWQRVIPALQADPRAGKVVAPDMPGRGANRSAGPGSIRLRDYTVTAVAAIREYDLRDVVIVGHSGGGAYVQAVVAAEPERVRRIVFLCAAIPERGHSLLDLQPRAVRLVSRALLWLFQTKRRGIVASHRLAKRGMCRDLSSDDCAAVLNDLTPEPPALLSDRIDWDPSRVSVPSTYILTTRDGVIRPKDQLRMAGSLVAPEIVRMDAGHAYPVMHPQRLVEILLRDA